MLTFYLTKCTTCGSLEDLICDLDGVLAQYGKNAWENESFLTTKCVPKDKISKLLYYREILEHLRWNQGFYKGFTLKDILSRVGSLTAGEAKIPKRRKDITTA